MTPRMIYLSILLVLLLSACATPSEATPPPSTTSSPDPTPTPTAGPGLLLDAPSTANRCADLSGALEVKLLVGPADAVGLEPIAVGEIPLAVVSTNEPYAVEGSGNITSESILEEEWGTYSVSFNMDIWISGSCSGEEGAEQLALGIEMAGEQMVEVQSEGLQGEYPWSGTHHLDLNFPLVDGAEASGEGWQFILRVME
jgi:hypothetical protein